MMLIYAQGYKKSPLRTYALHDDITRPFFRARRLEMRFTSMVTRRVIALFLVAVPACTKLVDPVLDPRAELLSPPSVYSRWWSMVENCSGLSGSMADVSFYQVPGSETVDASGHDVSGYWSAGSNRIVIAGEFALDGSIVRHEMLHALIRHSSGHPREYFLGRCGGVVACSSACLDDAGPPQIPGAEVARVNASALTITVSIVPETPRSNLDDGKFTLIVTATNPKPYPVVVQLLQDSNHSFGFRVSGSAVAFSAYAPILDIEVAYFDAGETKQQYFDFAIGSVTAGSRVLPPGVYRFSGLYESNSISKNLVTVGP